MKMLVLCFVGVLLMAAGTVAFDGAVKSFCQTGFLVVAAISAFLLVAGHFD